MRQTLRPYVTAGIAIVGASLIAVTPVAPPAPNVQQRALKLVDYTEYDASQLASATETNWSGLESILSSSNWTTDPDISQGLSTLFTDLGTGASNPVTNPFSVLIEGALGVLSSDYAGNAASTALTAVTDNVESALSSGDYSTALTDLENAGTTVLYAFLNGYPDPVGSGNDISPEFGLLTNTATDGAATGQIDALQQLSNTVADEVANLGGANLTTGSLPLITGNLDLSLNLDQILSALGLGSADSLTISGLLGELGLPSSFNVGDILNLFGVSDNSGFSIGQILGDLGLSDSSGISLGQALSDLGSGSGITIDQILTDLGVISAADPDPSIFNVDQILADLGVITENADGTYTFPSFSLDAILGDLGVSTSDLNTGLDLDSILSDLGLNQTFSVSTLAEDLIGTNPCVSLGFTSVCLDTLISSAVGSDKVAVSSVVTDVAKVLGLSSTSPAGQPYAYDPSLSVNNLLSDLGFNTATPYNLSELLKDFGISTSSSLNVDQILSALGISGTSPINLDDILSALGLSSSDEVTIGDILSVLGLSDSTQAINIGEALNFLGLTDSSSFNLDSILSDLGINPDESILSLLGIPDTLSLSPTIDLDGGPVATYIDDLAKDLLASVGSISPLSSDLSSLLTTDPTLNLEPLLSSVLSDLGLPGVLTGGDLSANLTNIAAELLPGLF